jgi:hypothetical protein
VHRKVAVPASQTTATWTTLEVPPGDTVTRNAAVPYSSNLVGTSTTDTGMLTTGR